MNVLLNGVCVATADIDLFFVMLSHCRGGVQALGKGFTDYIYKKFNPSQLTAISQSSQGYGDGGFTLIKGPPGKNSRFELFWLRRRLLTRMSFSRYGKNHDAGYNPQCFAHSPI